ncbi:molybdenum cofactor biosynthesis protein [Tumebacillus permanentifrigoris]|uniref:Molybdopterin synthase catalytic subunit n=1 Tax=Tumebacillus permanentifrigoris TaxID=378543 RepID=A0A316D2W9_9BACL|nr:molybdenum cofactor biosynthesis protein MoaE [Tumebacillus permanentifrigoris]PWK05186.1 molybdopterin synthase catalytic subunit [Tumebacillus permanentifrigoris]
MHIEVHLFAGVAEAVGARTWSGDLPEEATVADLFARLAAEHPSAAALLRISFASVNHAYTTPDTVLVAGDEIAILPPVSGGEEALFEITDAPLSVENVLKKVRNPLCGAVNLFVGTVREMTEGKRTVELAYEAYTPMAVKTMQQIADEIEERWPGAHVAMSHRIGRLEIEEAAVVIAVATPHRAASYEAGRYAIERLKEIVPVWKKEVWSDGTQWMGHQQGPWNPLRPGSEG